MAICLSSAGADVIESGGFLLEAAPPWRKISDASPPELAPPLDDSRYASRRRLHFHWPSQKAATLHEAVDDEIERITAQFPRSSNVRRGLLDVTPFETLGGIEGLRATFGEKRPDGTISYSINKYYFWGRAGEIGKICAHVYGGQEVADAFDRVIIGSLRLR